MKNTCNYHTNISIIFVPNKIGSIFYYLKFFMIDNCTASFLISVNKQIPTC
jgi:hypothetical protein